MTNLKVIGMMLFLALVSVLLAIRFRLMEFQDSIKNNKERAKFSPSKYNSE